MENASKALLMAGGILIGIILLSIFAYMFSNMGMFSSQYAGTIENQQNDEFNSEFNIYLNRELNIQDIITIHNLVENINLTSSKKIIMTDLKINYSNMNELITKYSGKKFTCNLEYKNNGKVSKVIITEQK